LRGATREERGYRKRKDQGKGNGPIRGKRWEDKQALVARLSLNTTNL